MKTCLTRDGVCSSLEHVLTLPIREADFSIEKGVGDNGEAEFARGVLLTPNTEGGMATPVTDIIGQVTTAQIYRRAFFLSGRENVQDQGRRRQDYLRQDRLPSPRYLPGEV